MNIKKNLLVLIFSLTSFNAYAYIDPGTGSILLQALLGIIAAVGAYITFYWRKLKNLINKFFKLKKKD